MVFSMEAVNISLQLLTGHSWHFRPTDCKIRGKSGVTDSSQNSRFKDAYPGRPLWLAVNWNEGIRDTWVTFQWEMLQGLVTVGRCCRVWSLSDHKAPCITVSHVVWQGVFYSLNLGCHITCTDHSSSCKRWSTVKEKLVEVYNSFYKFQVLQVYASSYCSVFLLWRRIM